MPLPASSFVLWLLCLFTFYLYNLWKKITNIITTDSPNLEVFRSFSFLHIVLVLAENSYFQHKPVNKKEKFPYEKARQLRHCEKCPLQVDFIKGNNSFNRSLDLNGGCICNNIGFNSSINHGSQNL